MRPGGYACIVGNFLRAEDSELRCLFATGCAPMQDYAVMHDMHNHAHERQNQAGNWPRMNTDDTDRKEGGWFWSSLSLIELDARGWTPLVHLGQAGKRFFGIAAGKVNRRKRRKRREAEASRFQTTKTRRRRKGEMEASNGRG